MGALVGIRVVEFANYVAGPYAGALLSDLGAEVVKVEVPSGGDPYRGWANGNSVGQATSGLMSLLTDLDDPQPMGISLSDHLAGLFAAYGVLAAPAAAREGSGEGQLPSTRARG